MTEEPIEAVIARLRDDLDTPSNFSPFTAETKRAVVARVIAALEWSLKPHRRDRG